MESKKRQVTEICLFIFAMGMILYGVNRGEIPVVLNKAVNVCLECIGLG